MSRVPPTVTRSIIASLSLAGVLAAGIAFAGTDVGSINFVLGRKSFTNDWNVGPPTLDSTSRVGQPALGIELTWGRQGWPAQLALDVLHSYDDGSEVFPASLTDPAFERRRRASVLEIGLGVRRTWTLLGCTPYAGAGGSWVLGNTVVEIRDPSAGPHGTLMASARARGSAFGFWAGGGIYRRIGPRFQLGLAGRFSKATIAETDLILDGSAPLVSVGSTPELDGGGRTINLVVGWSFPSLK